MAIYTPFVLTEQSYTSGIKTDKDRPQSAIID